MADIKFAAFIASSLDGYIARYNGKLDWLEEATDKNSNEDYGYQNFISSVDCIVMGRNTFEKNSAFAEWPFPKTRVVVLSKQLRSAPAGQGHNLSFYSGKIELLAVELQNRGVQNVFVDGGMTIQSFIQAELLTELTITQVPVLLGKGIPLFGDVAKDVRLVLLQSQSYPSGFVQSHYRIERYAAKYYD